MKLRPFYKIPPVEWLFSSNPDVAAAQRRAISNLGKDEYQIEEYVRQWVLKELITSYEYPKEWLGEKIIIEEIVPVATADKESDISIKNDRGRTYDQTVRDFFTKLNDAYASITSARQEIEDTILGEEAELLETPKFGLEVEEILDKSENSEEEAAA